MIQRNWKTARERKEQSKIVRNKRKMDFQKQKEKAKEKRKRKS